MYELVSITMAGAPVMVGKTVINMISSVNAFQQTMQHLSSKLHCSDLANFQNLASELEMQGKVVGNLTVHPCRVVLIPVPVLEIAPIL